MFESLFDDFPWKVHKGRTLPAEFKRFLSDPELNGNALGGRVHWSVMFEPFAIWVAGLAVSLLILFNAPTSSPKVAGVAAAAIFGFTAYFVWKLIEWRRDLIFITGKRVITVTGVIARNVSMLPLGKLTDMSYSRNIPGLILGYGSFRMETAGQVQAIEMLRRIPDPDFSYRYVQNLLFGRGTTDVVLVDVKTPKKVNVDVRGRIFPPTRGRPGRIEPVDDNEWYDED